ncbi:putative ABC multidrug transporter [Aspergillus saccharolyticus JOP 1030-1]|uniref:ABC transporter n=1 Tax=Aspergillus saccharolyticus JOP 1030-1 TaxID=1450539 RepID=A0A318Z3G7_9EURO|nr:ABC transporter [Aspergillus saccharolyticus JOP 1030-1]PYH40847.1 ABC transporter [Aspergillus saccharolyticus JOP 1030-1]
MASLSSSQCPRTSDAVFGPRVNVACRAFDFTVYFEDVMLACLPAALFLSLLPISVLQLWKEPRRIRRSTRLALKLVTLGALLACQMGFMALRRSQAPSAPLDASLAAEVLEIVATASALGLSYLSHCRSFQPSTLLIVYMSARSLLGLARLRTLWLMHAPTAEAVIFTLSISFTVLSLVLESLGKASILAPQTAKPATPEAFSGFWKRATFAWLAGTFRQGYSQVLSVHDLPDLDPQLSSEVVSKQLQAAWLRTETKTAKCALLRTTLYAYVTPLLAAVIPRLLLTGFTFCQPFLVNATVTWVGDEKAALDSGKGLIGAFAIVYTGIAVFTALSGYQTFRFTVRLRAGLISLIHRQTVRTRAVDLGEITAVTLMGTDVERIVTGFKSIHDLWACLVDIGVAIFLLARQLGVACLVPAVMIVVFFGCTFKLSAVSNTAQRAWIEKVEERIKFTSYAVENIKSVKMLGLSLQMSSIIAGLRYAEVAASTVFRKLLIGSVVLSNTPSDLAPMATFTLYVIIALVKHDHSILAAKAFTSISLISLMTTPMLAFIQSVPAVVECLGCFDRIQEYCSMSQTTPDSERPAPPDREGIPLRSVKKPAAHQQGSAIELTGQSVCWGQSADPVLRDVYLQIPRGAITMIVGPIGSGKTTLIESILGETILVGGEVHRDTSSIAYCSQTAWLQSQTIRQNILGSNPMEVTWYATVIRACALEGDLGRLPRGDQTPVVSNGLTLSGGQKQRIALARALYRRARLVLLDDIFSGIDATATEHIARSLLGAGGLLRTLETTVVLATHSGFLLQFADYVVMLRDGRVSEPSTLPSLTQRSDFVRSLQTAVAETSSIDTSDSSHDSAERAVTDTHNNDAHARDSTREDSLQGLSRQTGDFAVYAYYASAAGRRNIVLALLFAFMWAFFHEFPTVWLDWWTAANERSPNSQVGMYLGVYIFFGLGGAAIFIVTIISRSAIKLHDNVLTSTFRAPFQFFHDADIGSITNRFSQDMDLIDMRLPIEALNVIAMLSTCLVKLVILAVFAKYLTIAIPFAGAIVYLTQKFYLRTSRQLRFLDIEAKAPLYTHFLELVSGAATIRAFRWHERVDAACIALLNLSQRPVYLLYCVQQWLGFVLDMLVAMLAVLLVATVVLLRDKFAPGAVGVALVMVMTFNQTLMYLVKYWTQMETSIGAVSRVKAYAATTAPEERASAQRLLPAQWPGKGAIRLRHVVASHAPDSTPVLRGITMSVHPGEKVAICGPSGSGKTTLILALLRMVELREGAVSIDAHDLLAYPREEIRAKLNVITQEPFLMTGTVRFNIDPFQTASDEAIIRALQRLRLRDRVEKEGGLDMTMKPTSWSVGQRQLLCLARAMVRKGRVLILDEATSSVDHETEDIMQEVIETEFASHTVLAVMHRLRLIHRYDRVAVLKAGALVELDTPAALLARASLFRQLYQSGTGGKTE